MIIEKDYDNSIWYIIKGSKKLEKKVCEFLSEIPAELMNNIKQAIQMRKEGKYCYERINRSFFHQKSSTDKRIEYGFLLDSSSGELSIFKRANDRIVFELALPPMGTKDLSKITKGYNAWIGSVHDLVREGGSMFKSADIRLNEYNHSMDNYAIGRFITCQKLTWREPDKITTFRRVSKKEPREIELDSELKRIRRMRAY